MNEHLSSMKDQIDHLLADVTAAIEAHQAELDAVHPTHRQGAENLIAYTTLRDHDIHQLQADLASIGATRLTTTEPAVVNRLRSARNVVSAYLGEPLQFSGQQVADSFDSADEKLEQNSQRLLGGALPGAYSRIMVTQPTEAASDPSLALSFAQAGMDLARVNAAHDTPAVWAQMIDNVHAAAQAVSREIRVGMDLAGPKVRTGEFEPGAAVGRARVTRTQIGEMITPAKLWLVPNDVADADLPPMPVKPGRPTLMIRVDRLWLGSVEEGDKMTLVDVRDAKRSFTAREIYDTAGVRCVYAEGLQNAYLSNETLIEHDWQRTRVSGLPATAQVMYLETGDQVTLTSDLTPMTPTGGRISCTLPEAVGAIEPCHRVLFDDGLIEARAVEKFVEDDGTVNVALEITRGGAKLAAAKGINLPDSDLPLPSLTDEDVAAFEFLVRHAEIADVSFIRTPDDVRYVLEQHKRIVEDIRRESGDEAAAKAEQLGIVLKIETPTAYEQLTPILLVLMQHENIGVMIARGDLAVEMGFESLAEVPRLIGNLCEAAHLPTIMATQILENLAKLGIPTRAEITDATYALRAEAVMLNKGPHITDAIEILGHLSKQLGTSQRKNRAQLRRIESWAEEE